MKLTDEQLQAINTIEGNVLVHASAGSGKTSAFVARIANLIKKHGVDSKDILGLTFTKDAAENMRVKLAKVIGSDKAKGVYESIGKDIGQDGRYQRGEKNGDNGCNGFHHPGEEAVTKRFSPGKPAAHQRHGDDGALRKILNGNSNRQRKRTRRGDVRAAGVHPRQHHAHSHPFRDVVQRHGQHQHQRFADSAGTALRAVGIQM